LDKHPSQIQVKKLKSSIEKSPKKKTKGKRAENNIWGRISRSEKVFFLLGYVISIGRIKTKKVVSGSNASGGGNKAELSLKTITRNFVRGRELVVRLIGRYGIEKLESRLAKISRRRGGGRSSNLKMV